MAEQSDRTPRATLEDLAALNTEIAALVRAGLPLDDGLRQIARDYGRGLGALAESLREEMATGKTLAEAVEVRGQDLPPVYRAIVKAGERSGRLADALEGFADIAARMAELRRITAQAAFYPLMVLIAGWILLLGVMALTLPAYDWLDFSGDFWAQWFRFAPAQGVIWAAVVPMAVIVAAIVWWRRTGRPDSADRDTPLPGWIPGGERIRTLGGQASFADSLSLLVLCRLPLVQALPLAGAASGLAPLKRASSELATQIAAGVSLTGESTNIAALPPLVRVALLASPSPTQLAAALARAAETYRDRAGACVGYYAVAAPVVAVIAVGGAVTAAYGLVALQPYFMVLKELAGPLWK